MQLSAQLQLLEEELKSQSGDSVSEPIFRHRENAVKKLTYDVTEFEKIAKQFITDANEVMVMMIVNVIIIEIIDTI